MVLGVVGDLRGVLAIDQHGFADADLVARFQAVIGDAHAVDVCPGSGAAVGEVEAAIAVADGGVFPSDLGIGQADAAGLGATDA